MLTASPGEERGLWSGGCVGADGLGLPEHVAQASHPSFTLTSSVLFSVLAPLQDGSDETQLGVGWNQC